MVKIRNKIVECKNFTNNNIKGVKTPRHYTIFYENIEIFSAEITWISKSDNEFLLSNGYLLTEKLDSNGEATKLQNLIKDILSNEWLAFENEIEFQEE